tara:strand:+ start:4573 stop:5661 length:1089 start_codon:yes stop_codon:yes gene_type:complete
MILRDLKKFKRVIVTGGAGFIGSALIKRLINESDAKIFNLDKLTYASNLERLDFKSPKLAEKKYQLIKIDLENELLLKQVISRIDPDIVFHLAAESHVDRSIDNPKIFLNSNILGTFNLINILKNHWENLTPQRKEKFLFHHISTDEVFGSCEKKEKFNEESKYDPSSPYAASKACSDHLVSSWFKTYGFPTLITNCSNNYGPWQFPEKFIPLSIIKGLNKETIPLYGDGSNIRDWLFIEDHIDALLLASQKSKPGEKYCIGGFGETKNIDLLKVLCKILDEKLDNGFNHYSLVKLVKDRPGHDQRYSINSNKFSSEIGWQPKTKLSEGIKFTVNWYIDNDKWWREIDKKAIYKGERLGMLS